MLLPQMNFRIVVSKVLYSAFSTIKYDVFVLPRTYVSPEILSFYPRLFAQRVDDVPHVHIIAASEEETKTEPGL